MPQQFIYIPAARTFTVVLITNRHWSLSACAQATDFLTITLNIIFLFMSMFCSRSVPPCVLTNIALRECRLPPRSRCCVLLGCYAASCGNFVSTFRDNIWAHFKEKTFFLNSWSLKLGSIVCPEMSLRNYYYSLRIKSGDGGSLPILHYLFCIAHPTYAVHSYWITIQYLAWNTVLKHFITQFSAGACYFYTFISRHFLQHSYPPSTSLTLIPSV
jgi:hypothetical protein